MVKRCKEADEEKASLTAKINSLEENLIEKESELVAKLGELEKIEKDRINLVVETEQLRGELIQVNMRKESLDKELENLKQV